MLRQLHIKLVIIFMSVFLLTLVSILGLIIFFTQQNLINDNIQMMQNLALKPKHKDRPNDQPQDLKLPFFAVQIGKDDEITSTDGGYYDLSDTEFIDEVVEIALNSGTETGVINEYSLRYLAVNTPLGKAIVYSDITSEITTMNNLWRICFFAGIVSLFFFFIISIILARWVSKPVAKAWEEQSQFVADASHELKTPLTVILTSAELLISDESTKGQLAENILTMAHQMRDLVTGLLELSRAESGIAKKSMKRVEFSELISESILPFEPLFFEKGLELISEIERDIWVNGSETHLRQVLEILLDNAMKYSFDGKVVTVKLRKNGQSTQLSVSSFGDTIDPKEINKIFNRFYRIDQARSNTGSFGLGLSIAHRIVRDHSGKIWAESHEGKNTFIFQLPLKI